MDKEKIFALAKAEVATTCEQIKEAFLRTESWLDNAVSKHRHTHGADRIVEGQLIEFNSRRFEELRYLKGSPYFIRCDVLMDGKQEEEILCFGKFSFSEGGVYSWVVPASSVRFENPGPVQYLRPDGTIQRAQLRRKDQFMIVDGQIKFLATESLGCPRELIYQDQFSNRKTGFILPEIVAQMEKAQDQVIRANHLGPMLISGPAGSGKTTLALHRVAYLLQSPDLADIFSSETILVLVQDSGTKNYFSALLPGLGINNVSISTFSEWALSILQAPAEYKTRIGQNEEERDEYEYAKLATLSEEASGVYDSENIYSLLAKAYWPSLDEKQRGIFKQQEKDGVLDKIDLTLLLKIYRKTNGSLGVPKDYYEELENGKIKKRRSFVSLYYSLAIIDEFQNYLPEQLKLIKSCLSRGPQALVYVGDMAQRVQLGTIQNFQDINEDIQADRRVVLQKVYRNTRSILEYIAKLGYEVEIPAGIKEGQPVVEERVVGNQEEISFIQKILKNKASISVGILAKNEDWLIAHKKAFADNANIHVMTMNEAQGVEFELVFLVGLDHATFAVEYSGENSLNLIREKHKINQDLLYVALTRAISELYVLGSALLSEISR